MRLFVAVVPPEEIKERLYRVIKELPEEGLKKVPKENLHITLQFIGEGEVEEEGRRLEKIDFGGPAVCRVEGLGVFPNRNFVRVIWAGAQGLERFAEKLGERNFKGHITLARVKKKHDFSAILEKYKKEVFGEFEVKKIYLMESILKREGPIYRRVREFYV